MDCAKYKSWIYAEKDGELGAGACSELRAHLEGCERCRALEKQAGGLTENIRHGRPETPAGAALPQAAESRIWEALQASRRVGVGADFPTPSPAQLVFVLILVFAIGSAAGFWAAFSKPAHPSSLTQWRGLPQSAFSSHYSNLMERIRF